MHYNCCVSISSSLWQVINSKKWSHYPGRDNWLCFSEVTQTEFHSGGGIWLPGGHCSGFYYSCFNFDGGQTSVSLAPRPPSKSFPPGNFPCSYGRNTVAHPKGKPKVWILPVTSLGCQLTCSSVFLFSCNWAIGACLIKFPFSYLVDSDGFLLHQEAHGGDRSVGSEATNDHSLNSFIYSTLKVMIFLESDDFLSLPHTHYHLSPF